MPRSLIILLPTSLFFFFFFFGEFATIGHHLNSHCPLYNTYIPPCAVTSPRPPPPPVSPTHLQSSFPPRLERRATASSHEPSMICTSRANTSYSPQPCTARKGRESPCVQQRGYSAGRHRRITPRAHGTYASCHRSARHVTGGGDVRLCCGAFAYLIYRAAAQILAPCRFLLVP